MSTNKHIDKICIAIIAITLAITCIFMNGSRLGISSTEHTLGYENRLFNTSTVHQIDIVMNDWDSFIETCENEEYTNCTVLIDGEKFSNIGIRAKGNTSLSNVKSMGSQRYSFKLEFDQYEKGKSYYGLDKLCLNNLIQDNTMMKDYIVYQMMQDFGVDSPLCSYVYITVNGEDWGLYLALESVEDSFLQRNYGPVTGELYKPDSLSFGGGRGNGQGFNIDDFNTNDDSNTDNSSSSQESDQKSNNPENKDMPQMPEGFGNGDMPQMPEGFNNGEDAQTSEDTENTRPKGGSDFSGKDFTQMFGGMGGDDVKLKYIDDDPDSYSNIFNNAKTDVSKSDKKRLINSLKNLSEYNDLENTLDIEEVLRYFVVHNFVVNGDSYTGSMIHNYYLHEKDGKLGMIP